MFKTIMLLLAMSMALTSQSQTFLSPGFSVSGNVGTTSLEVGVQKEKNAYALVTETYKAGNQQWYAGLKYYHQVSNLSGKTADFYIWGAAKVHIGDYRAVVFEPGACLVFKLNRALGLQTNISTPIYEFSTVFRPIYLSTGVSLNWFIN